MREAESEERNRTNNETDANLPVAVLYENPDISIPEAERETVSSVATTQGPSKETEKKMKWKFDTILDAISEFSDAVVYGTGVVAKSTGDSLPSLRPRRGVLRDMFPRMPWHDIHAFVGGIAARDISSHFIQVSKIELYHNIYQLYM